MNLHDKRIAVAAQVLRVYLKDSQLVGETSVEDLASRALNAADRTVDAADPYLAWDVYARTHFKLEGTKPTESELLGMAAAIGAAFWGEVRV